MKVTNCNIEGVKIINPILFEDKRGFFFESYNRERYKKMAQVNHNFVQDNHSKSSYGVLRGLHFQKNKPQGKLIRVIHGNVHDFFIDLRKSSPTFKELHSIDISAENKIQVWLPPGIAHGFLTMSDLAEFEYKCTDYYDPSDEYCLRWNDESIAIDLPLKKEDIKVSEKDSKGLSLDELISKGII
jgi:dTDP-4-dehydrorhamnose 3,5-epimerase